MSFAFDYQRYGLRPPAARPQIPLGAQSVAELLDRPLAENPRGEALVDASTRFDYQALDRAINRAAHALESLGVEPASRVAFSGPNCAELVVAFMATQRLGAIWVGVNRVLAAPEKAFILADAGVSVFLGDPAMAQEVEQTRAGLPSLRHVIPFESRSPSEWKRLCEAADPARGNWAVDPFAPAAIAYTSGTTGFPKGAVHSQHNLLIPGAVALWKGEFSAQTRHGCVLPLTILNLFVLGPLTAFQFGSCCAMAPGPKAAQLASWIESERIGHFAGVPTLVYDLLVDPSINPDALRTLKRPLIGGADVPATLCDLYKRRFGSEIVVGYGMTEAPTAVTATDGSVPPRPGLCGRSLPHVDVRVLDADDRPLPTGEIGEICVGPARSGPFADVYTPMLGYWNKPEASERALQNGWFHSGDLGCLDAAGDLYIRGRRSDLIIRGGANIYPAEVERVLLEDPRVAACVVLGKTDDRLGERVVAAIQLKPDATASADELLAVCAQHLARYKVPEQVVFVTDFPRNAMGKIVKREVAQRLKS
jgi:long-chain acyl-CoA synthetase